MADEKQLVVNLALKSGTMKQQINSINKEIKSMESEFKNAGAGIEDFEKTSEGLNAKLKLQQSVVDKLKDKLEVYKVEQEKCTQTLDKAVDAYKKQEDKVKSLEQALEEAKKVYGENSKEVKELELELGKASKALETKRNSVINANNALTNMNTTVNKTESEIKGMERQISQTSNALEELENAFDEAGESISNLSEDIKNANEDSVEFGGHMSEIGQGLIEVGEKASEAGKEILEALAEGVEKSLDYEDSLRKLQAQLGLTNEEMIEFEDMINNLYTQGLGESVEDVAEALRVVQTNTDLVGTELEEATKQALSFADIFGGEVSESSRAASMLMKQFGINASEAYNLMVQGQQQGLDYSGELLDSIIEYTPHFAQLGLSAENMFSVMIDGAKSGAFNLDKVGDAIKELGIKVKEGNDDAVSAFEQLGLNSEEIVKKFNEGGEAGKEAFYKIFEALNKVDDQAELNTLGVALMGTMFEDLGKDAVLALGTMSDMFNGSVDSAEQARLTNLSLKDSFEMISRTIDTTLIVALRDSFEPILSALIPKIQEIVNSISNWISANPGMVNALIIITGLIGGVLAVIGTLITLIGGAVIAWGAISAIMASVSIPFIAITGIIGGVIAVVALLAGGVAANFENIKLAIENLKEKFTENFNNIQETFSSTWSMIQDIYNSLVKPLFDMTGKLIEATVNFIADCMPGISKTFKMVFDIVKTVWDSVGKPIADFMMEIFKKVVDWFVANLPFLSQVFNQVMTLISNVWSTLGKPLFDFVKSHINYVITFLRPVISLLGTAFSGAFNVIKVAWNVLYPVFNTIIAIISKVVSSVATGMTKFQTAITTAMSAVLTPIQWAIDKLKELFTWLDSVGEKVGGVLSKLNPFNWFKSIDIPDTTIGVDTNGIPTLDNIALSGSYYTPQTIDSLNASDVINKVNGSSQTIVLDRIINTINTALIDMSKSIQELKENNREVVLYSTNNSYLDGKLIANETTKQVIKTINKSTNNYRKGKGGLGIV